MCLLINTPIRTVESCSSRKKGQAKEEREIWRRKNVVCRALSFRAIVFLTKQKCKKANGRKNRDNRTVSERHQRVDVIVTIGERQTFAKLARETRSRSNALIIQAESLWLASSTPGLTKAPLLCLISILIPRPRRSGDGDGGGAMPERATSRRLLASNEMMKMSRARNGLAGSS